MAEEKINVIDPQTRKLIEVGVSSPLYASVVRTYLRSIQAAVDSKNAGAVAGTLVEALEKMVSYEGVSPSLKKEVNYWLTKLKTL